MDVEGICVPSTTTTAEEYTADDNRRRLIPPVAAAYIFQSTQPVLDEEDQDSVALVESIESDEFAVALIADSHNTGKEKRHSTKRGMMAKRTFKLQS